MDADSGNDSRETSDSIEIPPAIVLEVADKFAPLRTQKSNAWRRNLQDIRQRCSENVGLNGALKCVLTHSLVPEWPARPDGPYPREVDGMEPVAMGAGPSRWPEQYFVRKQGDVEAVVSELDPSLDQSYRLRTLGLKSKLQFGEVQFAPMVGDRAVQNVTGKPILFSDGQPVAIRPGVNRNYFIHAGGKPQDQITSVTSFFSIAAEAGQCLMSLPADVSRVLWKQWPDGFRSIGDKGLWISALYELAWQQRLAGPIEAKRCSWEGKASHPIDAWEEPREPRASGLPADPLLEDPAHWYSVINDLVSASIAAVDALLAIEE